LVRASWHSGGNTSRFQFDRVALLDALRFVATSFAGITPVTTPVAIALGLLAAGALAAWLASPAPRVAEARARRPHARAALLFLAGATALRLPPPLLGNLLAFTSPHAYHSFAAPPRAALFLGAPLP